MGCIQRGMVVGDSLIKTTNIKLDLNASLLNYEAIDLNKRTTTRYSNSLPDKGVVKEWVRGTTLQIIR